jgi:H/ACA ribonucleoprotein complex subunit 2
MSSDNEDMEMMHIPEGALAPIAKPLASGKLLKRLTKLVSKATKEKAVKRGVKETAKAIRKGAKGYLSPSYL